MKNQLRKIIPRDNVLEQVVLKGDLSGLSPEDKIFYHNAICDSLGLNPLTKPFEYIQLNGKLTLYARKDCTDQLRKIHGISIEIKAREMIDDVYIVTARASNKIGRCDEAIGAISLGMLKGEARANALMKAETKAKRRVTLSICGLGMLDEIEAEDISEAKINKIIPQDLLISDAELSILKGLIEDTKIESQEDDLLHYLKIDCLEMMPASKWKGVCKLLKQKISKRVKAEELETNKILFETEISPLDELE